MDLRKMYIKIRGNIEEDKNFSSNVTKAILKT